MPTRVFIIGGETRCSFVQWSSTAEKFVKEKDERTSRIFLFTCLEL